MAKVITFSRVFPKGHYMEGEPTFFVEQMLNSLNVHYLDLSYYETLVELNKGNKKLRNENIYDFWKSLNQNENGLKITTIRGLSKKGVARFKSPDEKFSPRVWTSKPYTETQIIFLPDVQILKLEAVEIGGYRVFIDEKYHTNFELNRNRTANRLAHNDGLSMLQFKDWFGMPCNFKGQRIIWKP